MDKKRDFSPPIILASSSPRRRELLAGLGLTFSIHPSPADESVPAFTPPDKIVEMLAYRKAEAISSHYETGIIIGSDTIVVIDGQILGKPNDEADAFRMLHLLQGKPHHVYTGLSLINAQSNEHLTSHQVTKVTIRPLQDDEIKAYIATGEPMDKAGSYAIQGRGATLVEGIEGDYFTVVGLPLGLLAKQLRQFDVDVMKIY